MKHTAVSFSFKMFSCGLFFVMHSHDFPKKFVNFDGSALTFSNVLL